MTALDNLYQELIIDHAKNPKNFGPLLKKTHHAHGDNPLCGDTIDIDLFIDNNLVTSIGFHGDGCAISKASASLMTERIKGHSVADVEQLFDNFHAMLVLDKEPHTMLKKLSVFAGVKQFPMRVKCATLCWHTLMAAIKQQRDQVTTE